MSGEEIALGAQGVGTVMSAYGKVAEGQGAYEAGKKQHAYSRYIAAQQRRNAKQEIAASQRVSEKERLKTEIVASRALAVAAASGGGASDPGVMRIISDIEGEGAYRSAVALYQGEEAAQALEEQAAATEFGGELALEGGRQRRTAGFIGAATTVLKGGASLYGKYKEQQEVGSAEAT